MFLLIYSSRGRRLDILMLMLTALKWKLIDISPTCIWTGFSLRVLAVTNKIKWVPSLKDLPWTSMQLWFSYWSCTGWSFCSLSLSVTYWHTQQFFCYIYLFSWRCVEITFYTHQVVPTFIIYFWCGLCLFFWTPKRDLNDTCIFHDILRSSNRKLVRKLGKD